MGLRRTTDPTVLPLDNEDIEQHIVVAAGEDSALIDTLIAAATSLVEERLHRAIMPQTWDWTLDAFPAERILTVPRPALTSVTTLDYIDTAGASQTFASSNYIVDSSGEPGRIALTPTASWPSTQDRIAAVTITYVAGYASADVVPDAIKHALRMLVGHWYENREAVLIGTISKEIEFSVDSLLTSFRNLELV